MARPPLEGVRILAVSQFGAGSFVHSGAGYRARGAEGDAGLMSTLPGGSTETPDVEEIEGADIAISPPWMTILHNCDCHTFEQVVKQLMKAIGCSEEKGWELAWRVHNTGKAVVKVASETECVRVGNILASIGLVVTVTQS